MLVFVLNHKGASITFPKPWWLLNWYLIQKHNLSSNFTINTNLSKLLLLYLSTHPVTCIISHSKKLHSTMSAGRRGVFDGVLEGLHQHWKHREVAKVITMQRLISRVIYTSQFLERESGGTLVSVDKLKEGYAIIIYHGKNYCRPSEKIAKNLLTKKEALCRSLEMQRIGVSDFLSFAFIILLVLIENSHPISFICIFH